MKVSELNGVKIYDLSSGKSIPEYLEEAKKRKIKLKQLEEYTNRIDLIEILKNNWDQAQKNKDILENL